VVFRDGLPVARRTGEQFIALADLSASEEWTARAALFANAPTGGQGTALSAFASSLPPPRGH
jgi:hypothetical protein